MQKVKVKSQLAGLPWGWNFYPHNANPIPIPMVIPMEITMGILVPTADLPVGSKLELKETDGHDQSHYLTANASVTTTVLSDFTRPSFRS